tara:strand:- start:7025 stop:7903 length:879 start_codon:yes stop_codon:yes gene_type:complete
MNQIKTRPIFIFLDLIKEYRNVFLSSIIVPSLVGLIYALVATSLFRADVIIISNQEEGESLVNLSKQYSSLAAIAGINVGSAGVVDKTDRSLAILTSRSFLEEFVQKQDLRKKLFPEAWNQEKNKWDGGEPTAAQTYELLISNIVDVDVDRRTNLITLSVIWNDPILAADWANQIIKDLNKKIREQEVKEYQKSINFIQEQLNNSTSSASLETVMFNLIEELTKKIMIANVREEYAFKIIDPAVVPEKKYAPSKRNIVIISFIVGLFISVFSIAIITSGKKIISDYRIHTDS